MRWPQTKQQMKIIRLLLVVVFCIIATEWQARAGTIDVMPVKWLSSVDGEIKYLGRPFLDVSYGPTGVYCNENHRDPGGNKYVHSHLPHGFPFTYPATGESVTVSKADAGWGADYVGYTKASSATFAKNCFAHTVDSPTVIYHASWMAFTLSVDICGSGDKSFGDENHVVKAETHIPYEGSSCIVVGTSEKMASSGVYTHGWGPLGYSVSGAVRKKK